MERRPVFTTPILPHSTVLMARLNMGKVDSPYYPPRARWYGGLLYPWLRMRRALHLEAIRMPGGISPAQFVTGLVVPGFAFIAFGRRRAGLAILAVYFVAGLVFIAALGYPAASFAYGAVVSAHAISIFYLALHWLSDAAFRWKLALALATLLGVWLLVYSPLLACAGRHWFMPLRAGSHVVVISRGAASPSYKRGDWMAYTLPGRAGGEMRAEAGFDLGPVLAIGGDRVEFDSNSFKVNGVPHRSLPNMPVSGELIVPENHWFVWPNLAISTHGNVGAAAVSAAFLHLATVSQAQIMGKPFQRWFGRRQLWTPSP
jgi:hypothetical protein